jgi:hypothetical protein
MRHLFRIVLLLAAGLAACRTWQAMPAPAPTPAQHTIADRARIHLRSGQVLALKAVIVSGDSLVGSSISPTPARTAIALTEVESVEVLRVHGLRTAGTVLGVTMIVMTVTLGIVIAQMFKAF